MELKKWRPCPPEHLAEARLEERPAALRVNARMDLLESLPSNKYVRVIGQAEAAVTSVAQNIAEGKGRQYKKEFIQFLYISEGSLFELLTLVEGLNRRGLIVDDSVVKIREKAENVDRKLHGLIHSLKKRS